MTRSCVDVRRRGFGGLASLFAVLTLLGTAASAQDGARPAPGAPVVLAPPKSLSPTDQPPAPRPVAPADQPRLVAPPRLRAVQPPPADPAGAATGPVSSGISIDTLADIDADSVGVLDAKSGGLGVNIWAGTSSAMAAQLLRLVDVPSAFPAARALARRLLLSAAHPPRAAKPKGQKPVSPSLLARRVQLLLAFGDVVSADALLRAVPVHVEEKALALARMNVGFLMNDNSSACGEARSGVTDHRGAAWRKALVFCQYLAGNKVQAGIGTELLREQGVDDPGFFSLAAILGGDKDMTFSPSARLEPLHLAMMRVARVQITDTLADGADLATLRTIAFTPNAALDIRLDAAERAEAGGALDAQGLTRLYGAVTFAPGEVEGALTAADTLSGPRGRALLYHAARAQSVPAARAEVLAKAFVMARTQGRLQTTIRAFLPLLETINPTDDLAWFAPEAARALYFLGRVQLAEPWAELALRRAPPTSAGGLGAGLGGDGQGAPATGTGAEAGSAGPRPATASNEIALWPFRTLARIRGQRREAKGAANARAAQPADAQVPEAASSGEVTPPATGKAGVQGPTAAEALAGVRTVAPQPIIDLVAKDPGVPDTTVTAAVPTAPAQPAFDATTFWRWYAAQAEAAPGAEKARAALLLALFEGMGMSIPQNAWIETAATVREMSALPSPGLLAALRNAADGGRVAETVLLALAVLSGDGPDKLHPLVADAVLGSLVGVGLEDEARTLAMEIAFGAGL
ncbi:MAG: hypothetical protein R3229_12560 [Alphaproteobacteria bacterium]|nr:hypothetical protein [Alphaproteobacteria bacterium]